MAFAHAQPRATQPASSMEKPLRLSAPGSPESLLTLPLLVCLDQRRNQPVTQSAAAELVTLLWGERRRQSLSQADFRCIIKKRYHLGKALCRET